ncbi:MAG: hypothetical protein JWL69_1309 [Phycisphaerales bacterium]|nr:hypothetical protein [Phycisphaerales bacterium]MDB5355554.1 hypothetical protein [Phycisphaerales bacterium]
MDKIPRESPILPGAPDPKVLAYHGPSPATRPRSVSSGVTYERVGDALVISVLPPPITLQCVVQTVIILLCGVLALGLLVLGAYVAADRDHLEGGTVCVWISAAPFVAGAVWALRRLLYAYREGHVPTVIRVRPEGLEIDARGTVRPVRHTWPRAWITDLSVRPGTGLLAGVLPVLQLQVVLADRDVRWVAIPWRHGDPMIQVEDNLRDMLGLLPATAGEAPKC